MKKYFNEELFISAAIRYTEGTIYKKDEKILDKVKSTSDDAQPSIDNYYYLIQYPDPDGKHQQLVIIDPSDQAHKITWLAPQQRIVFNNDDYDTIPKPIRNQFTKTIKDLKTKESAVE